MKPKNPALKRSVPPIVPVSVHHKKGIKYITLYICNTKFEDWVDKEVLLTQLKFKNRTLQYLRTRKQVPFSRFGKSILYYLPGIVILIEQGMFTNKACLTQLECKTM